MSICSFGDLEAQEFFATGKVKHKVGWSNIAAVVRRKLDMLHYACKLSDLKSPPGNRLELLKGKYADFYSIRVNDQWRMIFKWSSAGPTDVKILDYH